jgi:hypothetical protein
MATREQLHRQVDALDENRVAQARLLVEDDESAEEPDMVGLPEAWRTFDDGTPQPNWVALLHESRRGH